MTSKDPATTVRRFVEAFDAADLETVAACLKDNLVAGVTQPDASAKDLHGRAAYMAGIEALDVPTVRPRVWITQIVKISHDQVLVMIEIKATRKGRQLHNHAAYLMTVTDGQIARIWMVEALPEESDAFWNS
ncbi:MAG: nuclear transport factor 2 family protein [Pseudomonadota bacterium]